MVQNQQGDEKAQILPQPLLEDQLIESDSNSFEDVESLSSPCLPIISQPLQLPFESVKSFHNFNPFTDEDFMLELLSMNENLPPCTPSPIPSFGPIGSYLLLTVSFLHRRAYICI